MPLNVLLDRLKQNIFDHPYASAGKDSRGVFAPARKASKNYALGMPVIQINGPRQKRYLCFDIDRDIAGLAWDDANLPIPNLIITNPENGHAHLVYELHEPVWERRSDDKRPGDAQPVRYFKAVWRAMGAVLRADPAYTGLLVKNPFHPSWVTTCGRLEPYRLKDLSAHLDLSAPVRSELRTNPESRNCTLFDSIRLWAYRAKAVHSDLLGFRYAVDVELDHLNNRLDRPLGIQEVKGISKSVTKWVWDNYVGSGYTRRRGICQFDQTLSLYQRQQLGQAETCKFRTNNTQGRIRLAIRLLTQQGVKLTKTAVAEQAGLHRNTVSRHWKEVYNLTDSVSSDSVGFDIVSTKTPALLHSDSASSLRTVTDRGTECLRHQSPRSPSGLAALTGRGGNPDIHRKVHPRVAAIMERIRLAQPPPSGRLQPH